MGQATDGNPVKAGRPSQQNFDNAADSNGKLSSDGQPSDDRVDRSLKILAQNDRRAATRTTGGSVP
jgi:hypothetical protein